jgi:hypothetical protein
MRLPTTQPTPTFEVGDFVAFVREQMTEALQDIGFDKRVFQISSRDDKTLRYTVRNRRANFGVHYAGSHFRKLSDAEVLRYRLTNGK